MKASSIQVKDVPAVRKGRPPKAIAKREGLDGVIDLIASGSLTAHDLEVVVGLYREQQEREAKRVFDEHFAVMQAEFKPVQRTKKGDKARYAPLDELQKEYGPIIAKHGFSYRWSEESIADGKLDVILTISGYGHSQSNHKILPAYIPDTGNTSGKPIMNDLQAEGARSTYGQRYTFIAGFGLIIEDMDSDGALTFEDGLKYAAEITLIRESADMEQLQANFAMTYKKLDTEGRQIISREKDKRKKELSK